MMHTVLQRTCHSEGKKRPRELSCHTVCLVKIIAPLDPNPSRSTFLEYFHVVHVADLSHIVFHLLPRDVEWELQISNQQGAQDWGSTTLLHPLVTGSGSHRHLILVCSIFRFDPLAGPRPWEFRSLGLSSSLSRQAAAQTAQMTVWKLEGRKMVSRVTVVMNFMSSDLSKYRLV